MHPHPVHNFKKQRRGYLCNFMKGSHEIKKLYGSAGRGYEGGGRVCLEIYCNITDPLVGMGLDLIEIWTASSCISKVFSYTSKIF